MLGVGTSSPGPTCPGMEPVAPDLRVRGYVCSGYVCVLCGHIGPQLRVRGYVGPGYVRVLCGHIGPQLRATVEFILPPFFRILNNIINNIFIRKSITDNNFIITPLPYFTIKRWPT